MMTVTNQARCEQHYEQRYEQWAAPLRGRPGVVRALNIVNHGIVVVFYAAYALLLGWACVSDPWKLAPLVGVTAVGFVAVSFFRKRFNAPRPYECCANRAAHCSRRRGQVVSEPACLLGLRHCGKLVRGPACPVAFALLAAAVALAVCRVLGGVHFPRDVVSGALIGSATGALAAFLAALL